MTKRRKSQATVASLALGILGLLVQAGQNYLLKADVAEKKIQQSDNATVFFALLDRTQEEHQSALRCVELDGMEDRRHCLYEVFKR